MSPTSTAPVSLPSLSTERTSPAVVYTSSPLAAEFLEVEVAPGREVLERRLRARRLGELGGGGDASATRPVDGAEECALGELDVRGGRGGGR